MEKATDAEMAIFVLTHLRYPCRQGLDGFYFREAKRLEFGSREKSIKDFLLGEIEDYKKLKG